ncbi:MAG: hypothetical protein ABI678_19535, partial [Kofleriaceae bacterium]
MSIVLFSMTLRIALAIVGVACALAAVIFVKRGFGRIGVALGVAAFAAIGALAAEALVALTVRIAAPSSADFNEYRWVFLSPWGRLGL